MMLAEVRARRSSTQRDLFSRWRWRGPASRRRIVDNYHQIEAGTCPPSWLKLRTVIPAAPAILVWHSPGGSQRASGRSRPGEHVAGAQRETTGGRVTSPRNGRELAGYFTSSQLLGLLTSFFYCPRAYP